MMIVIVDEDTCLGCGQCEEVCPDVFKLEDEKAKLLLDDIPEDTQDACREAEETCPVAAIIIEE